MNEQSKDRRISRRTLLRGSVMGAGAAVAATATAGAATPPQEKTEGTTGRKQAGYRETEHVRRVYALSRF